MQQLVLYVEEGQPEQLLTYLNSLEYVRVAKSKSSGDTPVSIKEGAD